MESTPDATFISNLAANAATKSSLGINGRLQFSGNDGTVSKFGWKAQNKSLLIFSGEAYNVEMGVTNEAFPQERPLPVAQWGDAGQRRSVEKSCLVPP